MKLLTKSLPIVLTLIVGIAQAATEKNCPGLFDDITQSDYSWRVSTSHPLASGKVIKTTAQREKNIKLSIDLMTAELKGTLKKGSGNDTPPMILIPGGEESVITFTRPWEEYGDMMAEVTGAKDGVLRATILVPVSGHRGMALAEQWAKADTYKLYYVDSNGKEIPLVTDAKSLDLITAHDIEIPLVDGKAVTLYYNRSGSLGPDGYQGGRILHLTWNKGAPLAEERDHSKSFWSDAAGH